MFFKISNLDLKLRMRLDPEKDFATFFHVVIENCFDCEQLLLFPQGYYRQYSYGNNGWKH